MRPTFLLRHTPTNAFFLALLLSACIAVPGIAAALLKVDGAKSGVTAVFKQMNVPIDVKFKKFNVQIDFNNAKPELSTAKMEIDIASLEMGDPEFDKEALKKEWFNAAQFPKAAFISSAIKPIAGGKLHVGGKLTIKGKSVEVSFPMNIKKEGSNQVFEGALPIKRLAFNIGEGEWKDTSTVADEVIIKFRIVTTP